MFFETDSWFRVPRDGNGRGCSMPVVVRFAGADNELWVWPLRCAKEDLNVLLSRRLHLSEFSDGRPIDIPLHRVVLAIDCRFFRSVPSP